MADDDLDYLSLAPLVDHTSLEEALARIFEEAGMERPGGASGNGWSKRALLLACPHKYKRLVLDGLDRNDDGEVRPSPLALEIGGLLHQLSALLYMGKMDLKVPDPFGIKERLVADGVSAEVIMEGYRLFEAYTAHYEDDYLTPLAVELLAGDRVGNTCRYDLIARIEENPLGLPRGTVVVEMKTSARFDLPTLQGWANDGQIIQQMMIWKAAGLTRKYGKLEGVLMNIVGKQKVPQFHRQLIPVQSWQIKGHVRDLRVFDAMEGIFRATGCFPRNRTACVGRYGLCQLFTECAGA